MNKELTEQLIRSGIIILVFTLIYMLVNGLVNRMIRKYLKDKKRKKTLLILTKSICKYLLVIISILMILDTFGFDTKTIVASLGIVGLVVGLALQDIIKDFVSGFFIVFEDHYGVGDTIKYGDFKGEVISIGLKTTRVKAFTGEIRIIANRNIQEVTNYSLSKSLAIVNVLVSPEENVEKVEKVLDKLCKKLTEKLENLTGDVTLLGITNLGATGTQFRITAETEALKHYEIERQIMKEVKIEFERNKIELPNNQVVTNESTI